ncbi:MAG: ribosome biogenesis GTP-binding protein YihA/YsxC [Rickettsiales bacterium]|jgi:GTP-binding protein|nr:ribosome biogenesis GTP-binding protein YihA/YsxC [Rickettsiales bacterium]
MTEFIGAFEKISDLPVCGGNEFAFIGRSNVGKSSLINAIVGESIARTSNAPGRTRTMNLFDWNGVMLMDLPGYGYAKTSKSDRMRWLRRLEEYLLAGRARLLLMLIDSRRAVTGADQDVIDFCNKEKIPYKMVATKCDKKDALKISGAIMTSAEKKTGIEEVRKCFAS